jgi:methylmalonyl-CoA mutase
LSIRDAVQFVAESNADYYVICGRDEEYESMAKGILTEIQNGLMIDIAGKLKNEEMKDLKNAGLNGNIYFGQDMINKLDALVSRWEANPDGK